ncbi:MAG: hypothetical protein P4M08_07500 [Oligoflexia bacterium]|nr:hypothetical protein [Oligoflexia bacterium]
MKPRHVLCFIFLLLSLHGSADDAVPVFSPKVGASPAPASSVKEHGLSAAECNRLLADFQKAQAAELQKLKRANQAEMKAYDVSFNSRYRAWVTKEKDARHKYFRDHSDLKREEKRAYIADYKDREKIFLQMGSEERQRRSAAQNARIDSVKSDQQSHLKEFKEILSHGDRPPVYLWPSS